MTHWAALIRPSHEDEAAWAGIVERLERICPENFRTAESSDVWVGQVTGMASNSGLGPVNSDGLLGVGDVRIDDWGGLATVDATTEPQHNLMQLASYVGGSGPNVLSQVAGDFSILVHRRDSGVVWLATDYLGVRPVYWCQAAGGGLAISSSVSVLLAGAAGPPKLNERMLARALVGDFEGADQTPYEGIHRLLPGHFMGVSTRDQHQRIVQRRYWHPPEVIPAPAKADDSALAGQLQALLDTAVRDRLDLTHPMAAQLTGGLDSSAVTAIAARQLSAADRPRLRTYFNTQNPDGSAPLGERPFIEAIVASAGSEHTYLPSPPKRWETPILPPYPTYESTVRTELYQRTKGAKTPVLLSGWGGDQVASYAGRGYAADLFRTGNFGQLVSAAAASPASAPKFIRSQFSPFWIGGWRRRQNTIAIASICDQRFVARTGLRAMRHGRRFGANLNRNRVHWLTNGHINRMTELYAWETEDYPVEFRYPLLDRRLVEWCLRIPAQAWVREGVTRSVFRDAIRQDVPDLVANRPTKLAPHPSVVEQTSNALEELRERFNDASAIPIVHRYLPKLDRAIDLGLSGLALGQLEFVATFLSHAFPDD